jgi:phosphate transport system substrate-binding protein
MLIQRDILASLLFFALACGATEATKEAPKKDDLRLTITGSSTVQPIIEDAAPLFEQKKPGLKIEIQGGGSGAGIKTATEGKADIGMVSRALKPEESTIVASKIADDGIAILVHKDNPINAITKEQVVKLYTGEALNWKDIGGNDGVVTLITKEEGRSTLELFAKHFDIEKKIKADAIVIGPNGQAIKTLEGNPNAIAYISIGSAEKAVEAGSPIKLLSLDGVTATTENVRNATYPLRRPLNLVTRGAPTGVAKEFIDFMLSPEGQAVVVKQDFVPIK